MKLSAKFATPNKKVKILAGILIFIILITALLAMPDNKNSVNPSAQYKSSSPAAKAKIKQTACNIFSPLDAYSLMGNVNQAVDKNSKGVSTKDINVTDCAYTPDKSSDKQSVKYAKLTLKAPKTNAGATQNKDNFKDGMGGKEEVNGLGDSAYWDSGKGELNILAHDNWYILSFGSAKAKERQLQQTKKLASTLQSKL